jgi:PadR family transcriptional regulator, regulatory protein PadR
LTENVRGHISDFDNEILAGVRMKQDKPDQDLYGGLIRLHILHHAATRPVFGLWFIEELARHGYKLSPGTLYPVLHGLERKGYLRSTTERSGKSTRRIYRATSLGRRVLASAKGKVSELFGEMLEDD